jgi:hypothetical protein
VVTHSGAMATLFNSICQISFFVCFCCSLPSLLLWWWDEKARLAGGGGGRMGGLTLIETDFVAPVSRGSDLRIKVEVAYHGDDGFVRRGEINR